MTAPRRLLDEGADGFELRLLRAARTDGPTREARSRLLLTVGVAAAATTTAEGAGAASTLATATKVWALKSLGAAVLVTATGVAAVRVAHSTAAPGDSVASAASPSRAVVVPPIRQATAPIEMPSPQAIAPEPLPIVPPPVVRRPRAAPRPIAPAVVETPPAVPQASSLTVETSMLDAVRASLRAGQTTDALAGLDAYAHGFPGGALAPEASALRVEALLSAGDRSAAEAVARALVATQPRTSAAHRARALLNW
jgi:hypothetical protein